MASVLKISLIDDTALTASMSGNGKSLELLHTDFIGFINVSANNGGTVVAGKIQHSPDGVNWIDLVSFTTLTNTTGFERKDITESVLPYVRGVVTLSSGGAIGATVAISLYCDKKR